MTSLSNCTIAASEPTPMVILSLGHSGSTVTALRLANLTGSGDGNPLGGERVTGSTLDPSSNPERMPTETPVHDIHAYFCGKQREAGDARSTRLVGFKWKVLSEEEGFQRIVGAFVQHVDRTLAGKARDLLHDVDAWVLGPSF